MTFCEQQFLTRTRQILAAEQARQELLAYNMRRRRRRSWKDIIPKSRQLEIAVLALETQEAHLGARRNAA